MVGVIFKREFRSYFATPLALVFLIVFLVLNGVFTFKLGQFYEAAQADLRAFFVWHPWLYLFVIPAISMRLWSEEKRSGTIELILTLPVKVWEVMLGKFLAALAFVSIALALTFPIVLTVCYLGTPDLGVIAAGYFGSVLMAAAFLAIGCAVSAATNNQVISFVITTSICLFFILLGFDPIVSTLLTIFPQGFVDQLVNLSFPFHFEAIQRGVLDLRDIVYFLSLIAVSLFIGTLIVERGKAS